ncbi:Uncharacterised protein [Klebsiella pneumoniae]|uniref:Uncharacterized protein n=1 Tax=Klebsiella pneumoniae TaxID=573 RepID=A0A377XBK5_KLEPN|nr:Uncharacterised protein [Klebsiella pneumoniae]
MNYSITTLGKKTIAGFLWSGPGITPSSRGLSN